MSSRCAQTEPHAPHSWSNLQPWSPPGLSSCPGRTTPMTETQETAEREAIDSAFKAYSDE